MAVGFALLILTGAVLLTLPISASDGKSVGFLDALFTSTSAVCVTGLVVVDTGTRYSLFGQIVVMCLIQMGGLGIMTMATTVFLLLGKKITLRERMVMQEALNQSTLSGLVKLSRNILITTLIFEGTGAALLALRFSQIYGPTRGIYYGVFHAVSAFNNAGFDVIGNFKNLTPFVEDPLINCVIMGLIIFGGLGFSVIQDIITKKNFKHLCLHSKIVIVTTLLLLTCGFVAFYAIESSNPYTLGGLSTKGKILAAAFQSVTPRTAGFNTINLADLKMPSKYLTILLMYIGAYTILASKEDVEISGRRIPYDNIFKAAVIGVIALLLIFTSSFILTMTENTDFMSILFETTSAFGTVGLSLGLTPNLTDIGKVVIILTMFAGRVGPLTLAMALGGRTNKAMIRFPEERVLVG